MFDGVRRLLNGLRSNTEGPKTAMKPATLAAELRNPELERPVVFDPALRQYIAHRAGEPVFVSQEESNRWYARRMSVLNFIIERIARSSSAEHFVLRGSTVLASWFGSHARKPGDLDWIVVPPTWGFKDSKSTKLLDHVTSMLKGATINSELSIADDGFAIDDIWTYEKAPGSRIVVPWGGPGNGYEGTVQMDFVFGERMPTPPVLTTIALAGLPSVEVKTASMEQSLAWKLEWLECDSYSLGKDLYDAVLLAETIKLSPNVLRETFFSGDSDRSEQFHNFSRESILNWTIEWDDFVKEYPWIQGTSEAWKQRLADALQPLFESLPQCHPKPTSPSF